MLAKLNWRLHIENDAPWSQALRSKYCNKRRVNLANADKLPCSGVWAVIKKGREVFTKGSFWMVGRNSNLNFWYGKWLKEGPLRQLIQGPLPRDVANWGIKDILGDSGLDWSCMPFIFPTDIKEKLQATPFSLTSRGGDKLA